MFFAGGDCPPEKAELDGLVRRYGWFGPARVLRERLTGRTDPRLTMLSAWRVESSLCAAPVAAAELLSVSSDELIDRFLEEENLRIVAEEGEPDEEVRTTPELAENEELVSESLAEIYLAQGLPDRAVAIYHKLSLLNPEKSVYFAELIDRVEKQKNNN
ncbi:MAG: hypothetical protein NC250_06395 [Alistipes senegalensis]|nr:hypothetical protein [Alistipes senegalensis]